MIATVTSDPASGVGVLAAIAAGAVSFLSPCVLPLVPGYLSYITGMSGAAVATEKDTPDPDAEPGQPGQDGTAIAVGTAAAVRTRPSRSRVLAGATLFIIGFSVLFAIEGVAIGGIGTALRAHEQGLSRVLGVLLIGLGLLFAGAFDRFGFSGRIVKPSVRPRAGLASAPVLGVLFGIGWTPCIGPTLSAVLTLGLTSGTAARGGLLAFVYGLGIGIPLLLVALAFDRGVTVFGFARRNARLITRIGGLLLIVVGLLEVTGAWSSAMSWLQVHWLSGYNSPI